MIEVAAVASVSLIFILIAMSYLTRSKCPKCGERSVVMTVSGWVCMTKGCGYPNI